MSKVKNHDYEQAASLIKTQGVLSIVFGGIGVFIGLVVLVFLWIVLSTSYATEDVIAALFLSLLGFVFLLLPHVFLIVAGVTLLRQPEPRVVRILTIITLVIGVLENLVLLVMSILVLLKLDDYEVLYPEYSEES